MNIRYVEFRTTSSNNAHAPCLRNSICSAENSTTCIASIFTCTATSSSKSLHSVGLLVFEKASCAPHISAIVQGLAFQQDFHGNRKDGVIVVIVFKASNCLSWVIDCFSGAQRHSCRGFAFDTASRTRTSICLTRFCLLISKTGTEELLAAKHLELVHRCFSSVFRPLSLRPSIISILNLLDPAPQRT